MTFGLGVVAVAAAVLVPVALVRSGSATPVATSLSAASVPAGQQTLFAATAAPANPTRQKDGSVELGVRFTVSAPASVRGLRYFRTAGDTAAHEARLWNPAGRVVATLTFPAASSTGWQYASFAQSVPLTTGAGWIASYHTGVGYAAQLNWFGATHPTGSTLATPTAGLYTYGKGPARPASTYKGANYWIDALLSPGAGSSNPSTPSSSPTTSTAPVATPPGSSGPSPASSSGSSSSGSATGGSSTGGSSTGGSSTGSSTGATAGPALPSGGTAAPGKVGFLGDRAALKVVNSSATAPAGTAWSNGTLLVSSGGVVLDGVYVKGSIEFSGTGTLTIRNSVVEANGHSWSVVMGKNAGGELDISDSTIVWPTGVNPPGSSWGNGAVHGDSRMVLVRNDISGTPDGVQQGTGNSLFQQNYIHDLATRPGTHNDGLQLYGGPGVRIIGNYIDLKGYTGTQNAAVFLSDDGNGFDRPQVSGNYLAGGGFQLRLEAGVAGATVTDNHFGPLNGGWGEVLASPGATIATWSGNVSSSGRVLAKP